MRISTPVRGLLVAAALLLATSAQAQSYTTALSGANERPTPNASTATGSVVATLSGTTLTVTGSFSGLGSDYAASHLHTGGANESGPVIIPLAPTVDANKRGGTFAAATNTYTLTADQVTALQANGIYVNVHSMTFGGGEIRGQLGASLATVRTRAINDNVTAEGIVTRALGRNVWLQDDTAGLVLFGPAGSAIATAVSNGDIAVGDRVRATGRLVEFQSSAAPTMPNPGQGLLEIDTILDGGFTVLSRGNTPPAVQLLTLAQINAVGVTEDTYESEIVRVNNLTIDAAGATTFVAATNYTVTQVSGGVMTTAILRVGSTGDSGLIGTAIPTGPFTFQGPLGQFRGAFQLVGVQTTDLIPGSTASAETPDGRLSLVVANPLRGAATVRFSTETAQDVRVALYDVLGRTVRTVAEGASVGARTATLDAAGLAPGVYVLRLTAGAGYVSQTVTVVR